MFEHQIIRPDNKKIQYFLWQNYFHDSEITDVKYEFNKIIVTINCIRDEKTGEFDFKLLKIKKYIYKIIFNKYKYHKYECLEDGCSYLYGCFKKSFILSEIEKTVKKPLYHFSIDTSNGNFDVICERIDIKKVGGRIRTKNVMEEEWYIHWLKTYKNGILVNEYNELNTDAIIELAYTGVNLESYYSLVYLALKRDVNAIQLSRKIVSSKEWKETIEPALWVLGELGDKKDLELLQKIYFGNTHMKYNFFKEKVWVLEAIEKLYDRVNIL